MHISANRRYVVFMAGGYTIMSRLIEGEFLNYQRVIPEGSRTSVTIDTKEFIETIERASPDYYRAFKKSSPHHLYRG